MTADEYIVDNYEKIKNLCIKYCKCQSNADDLFQDFYLYIKKQELPCDFEKRTGYFFGYLLKNKHFYNNPERKYKTEDIEINIQPKYIHDFDSIDLCDRIRSRLPEPYKRVFDIMFKEGNIKIKELAERLKCSEYGALQTKKKLYKHMGVKNPKKKINY